VQLPSPQRDGRYIAPIDIYLVEISMYR